MVDSNAQRRHSMDTYQTSPTTNTVVKSQSTIMPLPNENSSNVSETMLSPTFTRKKSVSSKERLFSVESLHRTASIKSNDRSIKLAPQSNDTSNSRDTHTAKRDEQKTTTTFTLTTPDNVKSLHIHTHTILFFDIFFHINFSRKRIPKSRHHAVESTNIEIVYYRMIRV